MENCLRHHGILGMKWGVRRFQRKDGSLTAAGKKRYDSNGSDSEKSPEEIIAERRAKALKSTNAKEIYENRDVLTTAEIRERIDRIDTEARLASKITEERKQTGMDYVNSKMKSASDTIGNATNFFKSIDDAYSSVSKSAIGKILAKKLGLEPPKKEFNLEEFWKNRNKKSEKEIQEVSQRLANEKRIEDEINRRKKNAEKEEALKKAQAEVDDYNKTRGNSTYRKTGKDISDNKVATGRPSKKQRLLLEEKDYYEAKGRDVFGEGTSKYREKKSPIVDAVYRDIKPEQLTTGRDYVTKLLEPPKDEDD